MEYLLSNSIKMMVFFILIIFNKNKFLVVLKKMLFKINAKIEY